MVNNTKYSSLRRKARCLYCSIYSLLPELARHVYLSKKPLRPPYCSPMKASIRYPLHTGRHQDATHSTITIRCHRDCRWMKRRCHKYCGELDFRGCAVEVALGDITVNGEPGAISSGEFHVPGKSDVVQSDVILLPRST
jgi:hypothetical protein